MTGIMVLVGIISGLVFAAVTVLLFIFGQLALIGFGVVTALIIAGLLLLVVAGAALFSENRPKPAPPLQRSITFLNRHKK